jgi:TatA/E family protein of Tat protein translocase
MFGIGTTELLVILFIILLVFGSKKLPELARGLGKGINEFKRASQEIQKELDVNSALDPKTKTEKKEEDSAAKGE